MKKFFRDYWDLCREAGGFMKEHWLGTLIFSSVLGLTSATITETIIYPQWPKWIWEKITIIFSAVFHKD